MKPLVKDQQTTTMKTKVTSLCTALLLASSIALSAAETQQTKTGSAEFERMKTLVGTWAGKVDMGQGPVDMTVQYRLLAGGSVLEERCMMGTPNEMVSMYYDQGGKLAMTHYCMIGNRPGMTLKSSDSKSINFDFDSTCGINPEKESHMHALSITFDDANTITTSCRSIMDGKEISGKAVVFKRVKS
jgi:hypothetical protein